MAPESIENDVYTEATDVVSLSRLLESESGYLDLSSSLCWKDTSDLPQSTESPLPAIDEERDEDDEGNDV